MTNKIEEVQGVFNYNKVLYEEIYKKIVKLLVNAKEFDDIDVNLINFFKDIIQAKTFKYITPDKLKIYADFDLDAYIVQKCDNARTVNKKLQFSMVTQKLCNFKNNPASIELYRKSQLTESGTQEDGDNYF
jgi:hypothetical protein